MSEQTTLRPIEIGLILVGELDRVDTQAVQQAKESLLADLEAAFAEFDWKIEVIWRRELAKGNRVEPVTLIDLAREERDGREWDFVFVVTSSELIPHYTSFAFAVVSRSIDTAVISTMRIDPRMENPFAAAEDRIPLVAARLVVLMRQTFGALNTLEYADERPNVMNRIQTAADLDALRAVPWSEQQKAELREVLVSTADLRLEESEAGRQHRTLPFYLKSSWINRHEIGDAVVRARPWEFPARLNRLTTATCSTAVILLVTAELWELAIHQSLTTLISFAVLAIVLTTTYVTRRQKLLVRREVRLSEQSVITNVSAVAIVLLGMLVTFALAIVLIVAAAVLLFESQLIQHWSGLERGEFRWAHYGFVGVFAASLAVIVGALGASFEDQQYFRHITFVDEEI